MIPANGMIPPWEYPGLSDKEGMKKYKKKLEKEKEEMRKKGLIPPGDLEEEIPNDETPEEAKERKLRDKIRKNFDPRLY